MPIQFLSASWTMCKVSSETRLRRNAGEHSTTVLAMLRTSRCAKLLDIYSSVNPQHSGYYSNTITSIYGRIITAPIRFVQDRI
ncbi:hypothetical protein CSKR_105736 [Clonorchis sinensis]|uniref:Uncharacterized protein n=2 Tax=Clonorchis sinensis TaxID=79923 RepID=G7YGU7_CLOSI|nr:hypothetical protein CSKR_105736 [Clonorchis sinensis]GAA52180.1 hypothetical protein CLF_107476 [Clonorchis sinensis]